MPGAVCARCTLGLAVYTFVIGCVVSQPMQHPSTPNQQGLATKNSILAKIGQKMAKNSVPT
jgi:hypothetical protein